MIEKARADLIRGLGSFASIAIVVGTVIGTGVFLKARPMMCNVGSPSSSMAVWVVAGLLSLAGALTYAELTAMMPRAGSEFVLTREAYGPRAAFVYGWMRFTISVPGAQAAKAVAFAIFVDILSGGALGTGLWFTLTAVGIIVVITAVNSMEVSFGGRVASVMVAIKIVMIAGIAIGAFAFGDGDFAHFSLMNDGGTCEGVTARGGWTGFGAAMLGALWAYDGWNGLAAMAGEVDRPSRNIPLALIGGMLLVMLLYLAINTAYVYVLTPTEIASVSAKSSVATEVARRFIGPSAAMVLAVGMLISVLGSLQAAMLAGARTPFAMARDGVFFAGLAEVSPKTRAPVKALLAQAVVIIALTLSASFDALTDYVMFADWIFYAMIAASVFVFRRRQPDLERPYRTFGYPLVPLLFVLTTFWLLVSRVITNPKESLIGIGLIALGVPIYALLSRRARAR